VKHSPQRKKVQCLSPSGLHDIAYKEWGDVDNPRVLVCVHGVTRVSDDFDALADALADTYRVVCPDMAGRGQSGWLRVPQHYQLPQYVADMVTLLARLNIESVDWLGTSMGGLIGMCLAALENNPINKLILNDIGPTLNAAALTRIGDYIGQDVQFSSFDEGLAYIRAISVPFGAHTDEQWHKIASDVLRQNNEGKWIRHYDLQLAAPFKESTLESTQQLEALLWNAYDAIKCKTLLIRGEQSDLLTREVAHSMTKRGPHPALVEIAGVGHAPTFMHADQIEVVSNFLLSDGSNRH
jgi:pimeloyl-ACP methyl ester carboxylesterase